MYQSFHVPQTPFIGINGASMSTKNLYDLGYSNYNSSSNIYNSYDNSRVYDSISNNNNNNNNNNDDNVNIRRTTSPKKSMNMNDTLDRTFMDAIKEIELNYISLSKPLRLRIEKWIEKLCTVSGITTWRKERNIYTRLLLNMIMRRSLTEPFHTLPPDGSLPNLANYLKRNPDDLGTHESRFWRDLYKRVGVSPEKSKPINIEVEDINRYNNSNNNSNNNNNELKTLNNLVREQAIRIKLLEQQLHDERIQTELQIQRLQHLHRSELNNLQQQASNIYTGNNTNTNSSHHQNVNSSPFVDNFIHNMKSEMNSTTPLKYENPATSYHHYDIPSVAASNVITETIRKSKEDLHVNKPPADPDAFLAYLEKFQNDIKKL